MSEKVEKPCITKLDELLAVTETGELREQKRWFLKNMIIFSGMTIRATRFGFTVYNFYSKEFIEFSDESEIHYLPSGGQIVYPRFLFVYKEKNGTPTREIILRNVVDKMVETDRVLKL